MHTSLGYRLGAAALLIAIAVILAALAFEHIGGYQPCPLCLTERYAYYVSIPVLFIALIAVAGGHSNWAASGFSLVALAFLINAGLAGYHAGAEWGFWPGPSTCSGSAQPLGGGNLLKDLATVRVARCDQATWWFLGLSFAAWNVVVSAILWITSMRAAIEVRRSKSQAGAGFSF